MNKKDLWLKLKNYHFDHLVPPNLWQHITSSFGGPDASSKAFAAKIANKHGWSNAFALEAVSEYKKFVYLGVVSNFQVTPSKVIDVVWHEHILFTGAYRKFCNEVIHYQFEHNPELVPMSDETGRFNAQYIDTVKFYTSEFGYRPPSAIWGETKFNKKTLKKKKYSSREKTRLAADGSNVYASDASLSTYLDTGDTITDPGGGNFGGGGASGDWSDGDASDTGSSDSSDSGDNGGDSGGSCSGGCSGGCGGGD